MLTDTQAIAHAATIEAEVCVAGAGPAGITIARDLASRGVTVILLDAGGQAYDEAGQRHFLDGESTGVPYFPLSDTRARAYGGTSHRWIHHQGWRARPLEVDDFLLHEWIPLSGWPFRFEALRRYYTRAYEAVGLDPLAVLPAGVAGDRPAAPPLTAGRGPFRTAALPFASPYCFIETRAAMAAHPGVQLILGAAVTGIRADHGRVREFEAVSTAGQRFTVRAQRFVLALGGIENARLLLASGPRGVGNEHDQVGRYFMEHPTLPVGMVRPRSPAGREALLRYRYQSPNPPPGTDFRIVIDVDRRREQRLLSAGFNLTPVSSLRLSPGVRAAREFRRRRWLLPSSSFDLRLLAGAAGGATSVARYVAGRLMGRDGAADALQVEAVVEQAPDPRSRVTLSAAIDPLGLPRARLDWRLTKAEHCTIVRSSQILAEAIRDSGAGDVDLFVEDGGRLIPSGHYHHLGTTRMSEEPSAGVVDPDCRVHSLDNLYVAGSSVFPTGGWVNPTLTIVALALRLADHLTGELRGHSGDTDLAAMPAQRNGQPAATAARDA